MSVFVPILVSLHYRWLVSTCISKLVTVSIHFCQLSTGRASCPAGCSYVECTEVLRFQCLTPTGTSHAENECTHDTVGFFLGLIGRHVAEGRVAKVGGREQTVLA